MLLGNKELKIERKIASGKEGDVFVAKKGSKRVIYKVLNSRGLVYFPLVKEYVARTQHIELDHWYKLEIIDIRSFCYDYEDLWPIKNYKARMADELEVVLELYKKTNIRYVDFGFNRENIMEDGKGILKVVDYGSGFLFDDCFKNIPDRYYTFSFKNDYYKRFLFAWYFFHRKKYYIFNKSYLSRFNSPKTNFLLNHLAFLILNVNGGVDKKIASLILREKEFGTSFFETFIDLLRT